MSLKGSQKQNWFENYFYRKLFVQILDVPAW